MNEHLETLVFEHAPIGLIYAENRVIVRSNQKFAQMFGYANKALNGHTLSKLYPSLEEYQNIGDAGLREMKKTGTYQDERIMRRRDGSHFWCRVLGQSLDSNAPFARAIWSFADISDHRPIIDLTKRERQVAKMMAEGLTSKEIARDLNISHRTVEVHRARLLEKFGARNSLELVARLTGLPV